MLLVKESNVAKAPYVGFVLPAPPPDSWCERSENGAHHWVVARILPTPTQAAGWLHQCTLCDSQDEQPTETVSRSWPPRCKRCGSPKFRPKCDTCV